VLPETFSISPEALAEFCQRWQVRELAVFGSALSPGFRPDSDVDLLVTFAPDAEWGLFEHVRMEQELQALMGRSVDLVTRRAVENSANRLRREAILGSAQVIYVA
jgi:predicted nucleotidyltransferase